MASTDASGAVGKPFDPDILETTPRGPAHRIATVVIKNKAGNALRVNTAEVDGFRAKGYAPVDEKSLQPAGFESTKKAEYTLTEKDFEAYTVNELKAFCEDAKPAIEFKSTWTKPDFIAALLQAKFTPSPDDKE